MKYARIKIGDIFEIPLSSGEKAYGRYVFKDRKMGPLVEIYDIITDNGIDIAQLKDADLLFPPVITGLFAAIKTGLWRVIGFISVDKFTYPGFVSAYYDETTGKAHMWFLWDGEKSIKLGKDLPKKYQTLEYLQVWEPHNLMRRIENRGYSHDWPLRT